MARLVLCVLALVASGLCIPEPAPSVEQQHTVVVSHEDLEQQKKLMMLFFHTHEPMHLPEHIEIATSWDLKKHIDMYNNATAVHLVADMVEHEWLLPQGLPFNVLEPEHTFQVQTFFNLLYSAKTFDTFYKTAVYLRYHINEYMFVYVTTVAIHHRADTQGIIVPPLYEIFPSFFNNGEIMATAQRITTHGMHHLGHYPSTYVWDNNVVVMWNTTVWPYYTKEMPVAYFTHDYGLNNYYYNIHALYPFWLGSDVAPLIKDHRGEWFWFVHKQILARYYMERLSNGLGEIPELGLDVVQQGYTSGLVFQNGIPYPVRPHYFWLQQPWFVQKINKIVDWERRIHDVIDSGFYTTPTGEHVKIHHPEAIDVIGRLIEANVDSPNNKYYKDFISVWKNLLGNSIVHEPVYWKGVPWVLPSVLEQYQTALRDPAFYMIWKRVLHLFTLWQQKLPYYTHEELSLPGVKIEKVEVDKLVTYFEHTYMNVTNHLYLNENEIKHFVDGKSVVVQHPRLNHKVFSVRTHVHSEAPKNVVVRLFLAPKYDSFGKEIPLHKNTENFFQFDQFTYSLTQGDNVIVRTSNENQFFMKDMPSSYVVYDKVEKALGGQEQFLYDTTLKIDHFPQRLLLPKGRVGGMPFVVMVHISEFHAPNVLYGTGFDPKMSLGLGSGARFHTGDPLGYPLDRPLHEWQIHDVKNIWFQDVLIHHKHTPEIHVAHNE
ncbi:hypothetical protein ABMA27_004929 [Loxostege sticticalis]|uniref:Uncharacterized protein n=1 Tax=Loxostege sticticalis TaxID=481309 RepID=A0ABR3HL51_LOXSC